MTREEHMEWCKRRALRYCDAGDAREAYYSMSSDVQKHPETAGHIGMELGLLLLMSGHLTTPAEMREFIEGFN